jgi:UDP-N-acetylmuramate--alanine ligase
LSTFKGIKRRFEWIYSDANFSFIDDYAHHPSEIKAAISAVRLLFPEKKITGIFQPHLFSRTKDFADGFAQALDSLDQLYLLEIYPAREKPMEGVNSQMLLDKMHGKHRSLLSKSELMQELKKNKPELLLSLGAGDIGAMVSDIKEKIYLTK